MAQLQLQPVSNGKQTRRSANPLKIDMTPLVDLGFLLITFFIFTTTISEPMVTKLYMPKEGDSTDLGESNALTILLSGDNKVYCYEGKWNEAIEHQQLQATNYDVQTGVGKIIREKQKRLGAKRKDLMLLIKPLEEASYKNVIDALDEAAINDVTRYAIIDPEKSEIEYLGKSIN